MSHTREPTIDLYIEIILQTASCKILYGGKVIGFLLYKPGVIVT